jgi:carboxylesterase
VPICAPLRLVDWRLAFLPVASLVIRWSSWGKPDIKDERQWDRHVAYKRFHVRGVTELLTLLRETRGMLDRITQPILVVQSSSDHTVQPSNARLIYERVSSEQRELLWLDDCYHVVTLDFEAERLQSEVRRFILTHSGL